MATIGIKPAEVRAWAAEQGIEVGARGRLSVTLIADYLRSEVKPATRKEIARALVAAGRLDAKVPERGRMSDSVVEQVAQALR